MKMAKIMSTVSKAVIKINADYFDKPKMRNTFLFCLPHYFISYISYLVKTPGLVFKFFTNVGFTPNGFLSDFTIADKFPTFA